MKPCERAKRKKSNTPEMEMEGDADEEREETTIKSNKPQAAFGRAYEDALYDGERDLGDDDTNEEEDSTTGETTQKKSKKKQGSDAGSRKLAMLYWVPWIAQCPCHNLSPKHSGSA